MSTDANLNNSRTAVTESNQLNMMKQEQNDQSFPPGYPPQGPPGPGPRSESISSSHPGHGPPGHPPLGYPPNGPPGGHHGPPSHGPEHYYQNGPPPQYPPHPHHGHGPPPGLNHGPPTHMMAGPPAGHPRFPDQYNTAPPQVSGPPPGGSLAGPPKIYFRADKDAYLDFRVILPNDEHPKTNFAGRIIGHKGQTIKELKRKYHCQLYLNTDDKIRPGDGFNPTTDPPHIRVQMKGQFGMILRRMADLADEFTDRFKEDWKDPDFDHQKDQSTTSGSVSGHGPIGSEPKNYKNNNSANNSNNEIGDGDNASVKDDANNNLNVENNNNDENKSENNYDHGGLTIKGPPVNNYDKMMGSNMKGRNNSESSNNRRSHGNQGERLRGGGRGGSRGGGYSSRGNYHSGPPGGPSTSMFQTPQPIGYGPPPAPPSIPYGTPPPNHRPMHHPNYSGSAIGYGGPEAGMAPPPHMMGGPPPGYYGPSVNQQSGGPMRYSRNNNEQGGGSRPY